MGFCDDNIIATIQSPWHHSSRRGQIGKSLSSSRVAVEEGYLGRDRHFAVVI
jgi:hypothetical protein